MKRILVIKLGALGDFIQAFGSFAAVRRHHRDDHLSLLTTARFAELALASPWFDEVIVDDRPRALDVAGWMRLRRRLRAGRYDRIYDLQTSDRSSLYFELIRPGSRPEWSGIARRCSHPHADPARDSLHTSERQAAQLAAAGIVESPAPDLGWLDADLAASNLPERFVLLVPGGASHRPAKRWPATHYAALVERSAAHGVASLVLGSDSEVPLLAEIAEAAPDARNLAGRTSLAEVAALARRAVAAVGNDTGPMHLIAALACPAMVLFSAVSDPALCAPRGNSVITLRQANLADLSVEEVAAALSPAWRPACS